MPSSIDLLILPLVRQDGQEQPSVPGLHVARPPRRAARGRDRDQLILHLSLSGDAPLSLDQINQLLENLAKTYYRTSGTVTTAQRAVAESINQFLLDRNLRNASAGSQTIGLLTQVVLRAERLSLAQSGPVHAFVITTAEARHYHDPQLAGRGLGLARTTSIRYFQVDLQVNEALVITPEQPAGWTTTTVQSAQSQGPEGLRRRLLSQAGTNLSAALLQAQPGTGQLRLLRPVRPSRPMPAQAGQAPKAQPPASSLRQPGIASSGTGVPPAERAHPAPPMTGVESPGRPPAAPRPVRPVREQSPSSPGAPAAQPSASARPAPAGERARRRPGLNIAPLLASLAPVGRAFASAGRGAAAFLGRMLPDEGLFTLPASTMAFIAIAVPLLVVTISSAVYFQRGRAAQHQIYFAEAQEAALLAEAESEPEALQQSWASVLELLNAADSYGTTPESRDLRVRAQNVLDDLNYVERLDFRPALVDELKETAHITRIVAADNDLYMLNAREGVVVRATLTSSGYRVDPTFQCGPGAYGGYIVGAITDITGLPQGNELNATLLGVDANGNLLYCTPGDAPLAVPLTPPDIDWGTPQGLTYDTDDLYILDPQANAVWIYRNMEIEEEPRLYFGEQIPQMQDVIDMAVNLNDLYLLHTDGHMTTCVFSALIESPTRCEDPTTYGDPRPGHENGPLIEGAYFTEIQFAPPPDPSIYLLEPNSQAIYHFSVRLTFQRQYQSGSSLPEGPATSFAINQGNHTVFLAIGNQIFYAALP
jgi:hypothetical protein